MEGGLEREALGRLLDAVLAVGSDLALSETLRRIVESACSLVDARYAALGVLDPEGRGLAEFVHVGIEQPVVDAIGHLPEGHGILGLLITEPRPLRLRDLGSHPKAYGFPPHHPEMRSFLGVPIRIGEEVYGNLYLTEKQGAEEFSEEDERLAQALAAAAGAAIRNARLYEDTHRRERWLEAVHEVSAALLAGRPVDEVLELVARRARELVDGDLATIVVPGAGDELVVEAAEGTRAGEIRGRRFSRSGSVSGEVIGSGASVVLEDVSEDERLQQPLVVLGSLGPAMLVPMFRLGEAFGTLVVARLRGKETFDDADLQLVETFAGQASVVLEYGRIQRRLRRLAVVEDRERIARDLHDAVIQRLFATGLSLQGAAQRLTDQPSARQRMEEAVRSLDATIDEIRNTIFSLQAPAPEDLRTRVLEEASAAADSLGFVPEVRFDGPVDALVSSEEAEQLLATLREALSNAVRHAGPTEVEVSVSVGEDLELRVTDDGTGFADRPHRGQGLRNMRERAERLGGSCEVLSDPGKGTTVKWRVPLHRPGEGEP